MLAYVGMTHLGLVSAIAAAEKGFQVICFDKDPELIQRLQSRHLPVSEPKLSELLEKNRSLIAFTSNKEDLKKCSLVYVAPDIPTNSHGESDLTHISELISYTTKNLNSEAILVILSQVPPGFTRKITWPNTYYQVETLIFGQAVDRALFPERFIIGTMDPEKGLPPVFLHFLETFKCPILKMRFESAELSKISINMYLVSSVSTTNTIASLCEKIGADFSEIAPALKLDKRIGPHAYLSPGLGIAGGNLERDLTTFCSLSDAHGNDVQVVRAWQKNSEHQSDWVLRKIYHEVLRSKKNPSFALLGLSYKKDTASIKNSPALKLLGSLRPFTVFAYDPVVKNIPHIHPTITIEQSSTEACKKCDVVLVMTPWDEFKKIPPASLKGKIVIDPFGLLPINSENYFKLGV